MGDHLSPREIANIMDDARENHCHFGTDSMDRCDRCPVHTTGLDRESDREACEAVICPWVTGLIRQEADRADAAGALVDEWKDASGLECGGDPDGVTPAAARRFWEAETNRADRMELQSLEDRNAARFAAALLDQALEERDQARQIESTVANLARAAAGATVHDQQWVARLLVNLLCDGWGEMRHAAAESLRYLSENARDPRARDDGYYWWAAYKKGQVKGLKPRH